jgi:phosphoglucomutase
MAFIRCPDSGLAIADPQALPLTGGEPGLDREHLDRALEGMILSASGWRGVFAENGDEEGGGAGISPAHRVLAALAARVFARYLKGRSLREKPRVILGMDTRPTGPAIGDVMVRAFLAEGCVLRFAFITAAPEIMAYTRTGAGEGFVYISASHNPIGHNGLKFGLNDGGVLPASEIQPLIGEFRALAGEPDIISQTVSRLGRADLSELEGIYTGAGAVKAEAYGAYLAFARETALGSGEGRAAGGISAAIREGLRERPLGIAADFNGSARTRSIDREFFSSLGLGFYGINDKPREIVHRIVPEGESLEPCMRFLESLQEQDPSVILGYVPDCDGDRGNLVFWDGEQARPLEGQEVFALACVSELAHLVLTGELRYDDQGKARDQAAVVANGPTSLRIDRIAAAFGVKVFRAEVGEANVVGLARKLREAGSLVRILGEGAAGGIITHPAAVRDPLNTVLALVKLLTLRGNGQREGFFELWGRLSGRGENYRPGFTLGDLIAALPPFVTTNAYAPEALLKIKKPEGLTERYQEVFLREWEERKEGLRARYGITGWRADAYVGMEEKRGISRFSEAGRGGLKILFSTGTGEIPACIWMRGSGTEPVFRVMADVEGSDRRMERELIQWQRHLVVAADESG